MKPNPYFRISHITDPADACPLIVKQAIDDGVSLARLRNEQRILDCLQDVPGCPRLSRFDPAKRELAFEDFGGVALSDSAFWGRAGVGQFLALAEAMAHIVAAFHGRGVIHRNLNPASIWVRPEDLRVQIIDFDLASQFAEEHPNFDHPSRLIGNPAYLSPEQTGRMNRPVDHRTDLYSLGASLYALATGSPPFAGADALSLIHAHLARPPQPPCERALWLPAVVSELILALLAKEPDERYQSAAGLAFDLGKLRAALAAGEPLGPVSLKEHDLPLVPKPPRRLYGREPELNELLAAFEGVSGNGGSLGLFVAGYSGVGKTSLIREIHRPVSLRHGLFISGKFEQFQRDRPFFAPAQSLRQLCQWFLAEPDAVAGQWRQRILQGLGADAGVLFEIVPELETLLGPQALAPALGPLQAQVRLRNLLVAFVRQVAAPGHPLVLFIDDLQWADQPSLDFIAALLEDEGINGLLLIGAYRDNEVDAAHPLRFVLRQASALGRPPKVLNLSSLKVSDLATLLADMLHMPAEAVRPLADALHRKTNGNPFFTLEFVNALYREGALRPDLEQGLWQWDAAAILTHPASDNVVDFLTTQLAGLPTETADALVAAACLGNALDLGSLALATGIAPAVLAERLVIALERGIMTTANALEFYQAAPGVCLQFCHDRMAQAVCQLRDEAELKRLHLAMARRFALHTDDPVRQFSAAEHYAAAAPLALADAERVAVRELFRKAAAQARQSSSFSMAERFLRLSLALLAEDAWHSEPEAAFSLHTDLHLVLYCLARHAEADAVYALLAEQAASPLALVEPACVQTVSLGSRTLFAQSTALGCGLLAKLGIPVPLDSLSAAVENETRQFYVYVREGALERMPNSPDLLDPRWVGAAKLASRMGPAILFSQPLMSMWITLWMIRLWIERGFCPFMLMQAMAMIQVTVGLRGDYASAYRLAAMSLATGLAREQGADAARARHGFASMHCHWFQGLEEGLAHARAAREQLSRHGDLELSCYTYRTTHFALFDTCATLDELRSENAAGLRMAQKNGNRLAEDIFVIFRQLARALTGETLGPGRFDDAGFDEQAHQILARRSQMALGFFHIYRALSACLFNDEEALQSHAEAAVERGAYTMGFYPSALAYVLHSLALIQHLQAATDEERPSLLERLAANQTWLASRAADAPMNFGHLHDLVEAERLSLLGQPWEAFSRFEQAMRLAQGRQRPWHHALITERAGRFCLCRGLEHAGRALLARAHALYLRWGACGKARAMREALPFLDSPQRDFANGGHTDVLDHQALLLAAQALASETSQPGLVARVLELLSQLTGATDALLLLQDDAGGWWLEGGIHGPETLPRMTLNQAEAQGVIAINAFRLGLKLRQPLVSDDAAIDSRLEGDPHFACLPLCSLLALPVVTQGRIKGFLILENRLFRAAFTAQRVETVSLLCGQLAVSIENVRIYQSLERKVAERTRALEIANRRLEALSLTDSLTGLANRRCFDETLSLEWQRAGRSHRPLALAIIDVDYFKKYNDYYGHQAGDECLRTVAQAIQSQAHQTGGLAARYGGEEFAFIAPEVEAGNMLALAEAIRTLLEFMALPHAQSPLGRISISIGVAVQIPEETMTSDDLVRKADEALYSAKTQGRNRVTLAPAR